MLITQFDSPKRGENDYVMDDLFWDVEVIDDWEEKMKELTTPE